MEALILGNLGWYSPESPEDKAHFNFDGKTVIVMGTLCYRRVVASQSWPRRWILARQVSTRDRHAFRE